MSAEDSTITTSSPVFVDRFRGPLLGLAVCDALGTTAEFQTRGSFEPITTIRGEGPFNLLPGQWTDDTSMALCLAESLCEKNEFDLIDQLKRYSAWYQNDHMSSTGVLFDIGMTTRKSLNFFEKIGYPYCSAPVDYSSGNGSLMRLAPVPLFFSGEGQLEDCIIFSGESSRTTHGSLIAIDSCRFYAALIYQALRSQSKEQLFSSFKWELRPENERQSIQDSLEQQQQNKTQASKSELEWSKKFTLCQPVWNLANRNYRNKKMQDLKPTGYVVDSIEAALWCFEHSSSFKEGALLAVNLGGDADTIGAIYGQLAGAFYGESNIPDEWKELCAFKELILCFIDQLYHSMMQRQKEPSEGRIEKLPKYEYFKKKFDIFEKEYSEIKRRTLPGPKRFHSLEEFQERISNFVKVIDYKIQQDNEEKQQQQQQQSPEGAIEVQRFYKQFFETQLKADEELVKIYL